MIGTLSHRALQEEQMDAPDLPEQVYAEVLSGLSRVRKLSIARSFRPQEWQSMLETAGLAGSARLRRTFPFRLCVEQIR